MFVWYSYLSSCFNLCTSFYVFILKGGSLKKQYTWTLVFGSVWHFNLYWEYLYHLYLMYFEIWLSLNLSPFCLFSTLSHVSSPFSLLLLPPPLLLCFLVLHFTFTCSFISCTTFVYVSLCSKAVVFHSGDIIP